MKISDERIAANRRNAQLSTGPRTEAGKVRSSLNAYRHGLTGQVVVLPEGDMQAYKTFCQGYFTEWDPQTPTETQMVQTIIDTQWLLNRARADQHSIVSLGHFGQAANIETGHAEVHAALTGARQILQRSRELDNISKHELRQTKILHTTMKLLEQRQADRRAREEAELPAAAEQLKLHKMKNIPYTPAEDGFVLTIARIENWLGRARRKIEAQIAASVGFDHSRFLQAVSG